MAEPMENAPRRFNQCDDLCTVDCGHCKGQRRAQLDATRDALLADIPPGTTDWWAFVAARFPQYQALAAKVWWTHYSVENGLYDTCKDIGHEFWCRYSEGSCRRRGAMTCNETEEERLELDALVEEKARG